MSLHADPRPLPPSPERAFWRQALVPLVVLLLAAGAYLGWQAYQAKTAVPEPAQAVAPLPAPSLSATPLPAQTPPPIEHPIEAAPADAGAGALPALAASDDWAREQLDALLGRESVLRFLQWDGFVRRVVATVDNLGREQAPVRMWPVNPTPGRFTVATAAGGGETMAADNAQRYAPLIRLMEAVDSAQLVALYRRLYPLCQQAYEELGFPGRYFNDRLVRVMDLLIATPVPSSPPLLTLVQVKGEVPSTRPWVRYEYADPQLEALAAGQKILLRVGPEQQRRVQAKLQDLRERIARP